ncbi:MAG: carboxypeptidase regulatory-like domain-containing protein, partial [Acidobacteria bacterium]|nr:carboxypeptidase regulatory-like domain-containing protein [Acidobacteriota bacterium]
MKKQALWLSVVFLAFSSVSFAQGLGSIVGTVTDPSGAVLAGAKVTAIEIGTGILRTTAADAQGYYVIPSVKPARYSLSIESPGFRTEKQELEVLADQALTVNVHLQLGAPTEVVEVTGTDLQVDTTTSTVKQVIEEKRIVELPLNGRNAATLALLVPGVVNSPNGGSDQGATKTFPGAVTFSSNGTRQDTISYNLDGGNYVDEYTNVNQPFPFPDALQEFSVQTSNYSAEYGQNAGAVVNVITKSGTNSFHGDAFEFNRNPIFNAQNYFATPTTPDRIKRNQFGGTFGGPILHDKMYFFAGYQRTQFRNLVLGSAKVVGQTDITNFLAKGPFGTPGAIDPAIAKMIGVVPGCNVAGCGAAFNGSAGQADPNAKFALAGAIPTGSNPTIPFSKPDTENFDSGMGKLDYVLGEKDKATLRYEYDRFTKAPVFNPMFLVQYTDATNSIVSQSGLIHETHTFSPTLLNDARISYSREIASRGPSSTAVNVVGFGSALPFQPTPSAIQGIGVQNGFSFGDNPTGLFVRQNYGFANDVSWVRGRHDLHFGGSIERSHVDLVNEFNQPGLFGFGNQDNYLTSQGVFGASPFSTYQLFLAGILSDCGCTGNGYAFQQGAGEFKQNRNIFAGVYFQDNFHMTRRLTLNLGLRYEPVLPWSDKGNRFAQVNLAAMAQGVTSKVYPNAPPGIFFSGQNGIPSDSGMPDNALRASLTNFEPRLGFAYDVTGDGKTSVRGGVGIFYDSRVMGMLSNRFVDEWPFSPQYILSTAGGSSPTASSAPGSFSDPLCTLASTQATLHCNGQQAANYPKFPSPFPAPTNFAYIPPFNEIAVSYDPTGNYRVPVVYAYNLSVERELPGNAVGRLAYVGSLSRHILETQFLNFSAPVGSGGFPGCGPKSVSSPGAPGTGLANCTVFTGSGGKFA